MKHFAALITGLVVCFSACKKHDDCHEPPAPENACELVQSIVTGYDDMPGQTSQFRKEYDPVTGKVNKVVAGLYGLYLEDSIALLLRYSGKKVYFISEENKADTILTATFDASDRLVEMRAGNTTEEPLRFYFEQATDFGYSAGKLSVITRHLTPDLAFDFYMAYDQNGNLVRVFQQTDDANAGTFYTYDLSVRATAQYYSDQNGTDYFNTQIYLAAFLGWLPELEPVNKRTSFRQVFNDEDTTDNEPGYVFNHTDLTGHVYDSDGKLLSYKIADGNITFINNWKCSARKDPN
jgi:hypothetical protein